MTDEEKKIIVDEDWKTQVENERAAAAKVDSGAAEENQYGAVPDASFEVLVSTLAAQAMAAMGHVVDPNTGKPMEIRLDIAKLQIDLLSLLDEKTKGNLSLDEEKLLTEAIHNMRMLYVASNSAKSGSE